MVVMDLDEVVAHAEGMGLRVEWSYLGTRSGELRPDGAVIINPRKSLLTQRVTVAHECGHAHHGHDWRERHSRERDEREADLYAAELLIDPLGLRAAASLYGGDVRVLAKELGVTARLLRLWAETHRLGA